MNARNEAAAIEITKIKNDTVAALAKLVNIKFLKMGFSFPIVAYHNSTRLSLNGQFLTLEL